MVASNNYLSSNHRQRWKESELASMTGLLESWHRPVAEQRRRGRPRRQGGARKRREQRSRHHRSGRPGTYLPHSHAGAGACDHQCMLPWCLSKIEIVVLKSDHVNATPGSSFTSKEWAWYNCFRPLDFPDRIISTCIIPITKKVKIPTTSVLKNTIHRNLVKSQSLLTFTK